MVQAAVEDADEPVREGSEGLVVGGAAGSSLVVERAGSCGVVERGERLQQLAEIIRLDRAHHRPVAGDSEVAEHVKIAARAHQTMIWSRVQQVNALRSLLREYYPAALAAFGTDLASRDALAV